MKKEELIRNLKLELKKIENKKYDTFETRYDLMIKDILGYVENSIPKRKIEDKIKEYLEYDRKVKTYLKDGRENFTIEYFKAKTLQELLEDK